MPLQPIAPREPAHQAAEHILRRAILRGELAPGERLPPERELATQLGVSRLTLRSALAMLDAAGLVTVRHGSGYVVRDFVRDGGPDLLAGVAELASERGEFPDIAAELLRVRRHLAHAALERLVEHPPTPAAIHAVVGAIDAMASVGADELALARADLAVLAPSRVRALVLEMPVLENALPAAAAAFVPLALAIRISRGAMGVVAAVARRIPRTHYLVDIMIDFIRRDPTASLAVLDGLIFGRVAPPIEDRRALPHPTLVIGHPSDPIHPFSDADRIARELANAQLVTASSIFEWRRRPDRLDAVLAQFLDEVWLPQVVAA